MPPTKSQKATSNWARLAKAALAAGKVAYDANKNSSTLSGPFGTSLGIKRKLFQDGGSRKVKIMQTPGKSLVVPKRTGAANSRSGGRLYSRRYRPRKRDRMAVNGVSFTREIGREVSTTSQVLWFGHNTGGFTDLRNNMWRCIIKKLMNKSQLTIRDFSAAADQITPGDKFVLTITTVDGTTTTVEHTFVAAQSWDTITNTFFTSVLANSTAGVTLRSIGFVPLTNAVGAVADRAPCRLDLENMYIKVYMKSSMKIQNRTVNGTDQQTDEVDNVPLYGRIYAGSGNGTIQNTRTDNAAILQLIADSANGEIIGTALDGNQQEPLPQIFFPHVSEKGKIHLDPGVIKTSVLVFKKNMLLSKFREHLGFDSSVTKTRSSMGKFRFFALERMIQTSASQTILAGYEINHYMSIDMYNKINNLTLPINTFTYA